VEDAHHAGLQVGDTAERVVQVPEVVAGQPDRDRVD
jgi:hypothetical protein